MIYSRTDSSQICDVDAGTYQDPSGCIHPMNLIALEAEGYFNDWELLE